MAIGDKQKIITDTNLNTEVAVAIAADSTKNFLTDAQVTKLGGIEDLATADQTGAEIKTAYELELDTNAFTDAEKTKLSTVEQRSNHTGTQAANTVVPTNIIGTPTIGTDMDEMNRLVNTSGVVDGCAITDNGNGTVSIASGTAFIRDIADSLGVLYAVEAPATLNITLTDSNTNFIYFEYNAGTPRFGVTTVQSDINCQNRCLVYIVHRNGTTLHWIDDRQHGIDISNKTRAVFRSFSYFIHAEGGTILSEAGNFGLAVTAGRFYYTVTAIDHLAFNTTSAGTAVENVYHLFYRDAGTGWIQADNAKYINPTLYDNGTGVPAVLSDDSKYGVSWVYVINNEPSMLAVVMGQEEFATQAAAENAVPPTALPSLLSGMGSLIGFVIYNKVGTSFANVLSAFTQTFNSGVAQSHDTLAGIQGGAINDYIHLTTAEYNDNIRIGWKDNVQPFTNASANGTLEPSWEDIGNGIFANRFTVGEEAFVTFHTNHDYALGTDAYPHIHFISDAIINAGETVTWQIGYTKAKGHSQGQTLTGSFATFNMVYTAPAGGTIPGEHILLECDPIYAFDLVEPDTLILIRARLVSTTTAGRIFGLQCDLHYQANMDATLNKAPDFYA